VQSSSLEDTKSAGQKGRIRKELKDPSAWGLESRQLSDRRSTQDAGGRETENNISETAPKTAENNNHHLGARKAQTFRRRRSLAQEREGQTAAARLTHFLVPRGGPGTGGAARRRRWPPRPPVHGLQRRVHLLLTA
jgi:hypothetical protein